MREYILSIVSCITLSKILAQESLLYLEQKPPTLTPGFFEPGVISKNHGFYGHL